MRRYIYTLLRYWHIALVPVLVLPVGAFFLMKTPPTTYGTANIWVDQTSLAQLSYVEQGVSPAQNMADYLSQLLLSQSFDYSVAKRSPRYMHYLLTAPHPRGIPQDPRVLAATDLSKYATAVPAGPNLVTIAYEGRDPAIAAQVVRAILKESAYETLQLSQQQNNKDLARSTRQLKNAQASYTKAVGNLGAYMTANNIKSADLASEQLSDPQLAGLYQAVQTAQSNLTNAQQRLSQVQSQQTSQASPRVLDPPSAKIVLTSKKKELSALLIPLVLALVLSGAFIVIMTLRDRSLRSPEDVADLLGLPVLAVVPHREEFAVAAPTVESMRVKPARGA